MVIKFSQKLITRVLKFIMQASESSDSDAFFDS